MGKKIKKVVWTEPARKDLQNIYNYYAEISLLLAERQIVRIIDTVNLLETGFEKMGQKEPLLISFENQYRYLVKDNYKIIYHLLPDEIVIDMIFDTRQNPEKIKRNK